MATSIEFKIFNFFYIATFFLEHWKRKQSEMQYDWDLIGFEDEEVCNLIPSHVFTQQQKKLLFLQYLDPF